MKSLLLLMAFFPPLLWSQQSVVRDNEPPAKWKVDIDTSSGTEVRLPSVAMRRLPQCRGGMCYALFSIDPPTHPDASGKLPPAGPSTVPRRDCRISQRPSGKIVGNLPIDRASEDKANPLGKKMYKNRLI
jgi:hypothetical protein